MLFSRTAAHGIYALCYRNRAKSGFPLSSPTVASALGIPQDQAAAIIQSLNNVGLVHSIRARYGRYILVK